MILKEKLGYCKCGSKPRLNVSRCFRSDTKIESFTFHTYCPACEISTDPEATLEQCVAQYNLKYAFEDYLARRYTRVDTFGEGGEL